MTDLKPIPTKYNGIQFRSRLEARWALFFDQLGIEYYYEYEGFQCKSGWYVPDFYLPKHGWFEIKPTGPTLRERNLVNEMSVMLDDAADKPGDDTRQPKDYIYILIGFPLERFYAPDLILDDEDQKEKVWLENFETGEIYFSLSIWESILTKTDYKAADIAFTNIGLFSCIYCSYRYFTCRKFSDWNQAIAACYDFSGKCSHSLRLSSYEKEKDSEIVGIIKKIKGEVSEAYKKLDSKHNAVRHICPYRNTPKVDAAFEFAKKFRFY